MNAGDINLSELIGLITAFLLTLSIFSYIFGDNVIFRISINIFIGVSAGLVITAVLLNVLWPKLLVPMIEKPINENILLIFPIIMGLLTFSFTVPRFSALGSLPLAFLVGVGAATIIGGAVLGTIVPLVGITIDLFDPEVILAPSQNFGSTWINSLLVLIGLVTTLMSFQFTNQPHTDNRPGFKFKTIQSIGRGFIAIAFGVIFFGVMIASQTALVERVNFLKAFIRYFLVPGG
jgi:hypothetical protein